MYWIFRFNWSKLNNVEKTEPTSKYILLVRSGKPKCPQMAYGISVQFNHSFKVRTSTFELQHVFDMKCSKWQFENVYNVSANFFLDVINELRSIFLQHWSWIVFEICVFDLQRVLLWNVDNCPAHSWSCSRYHSPSILCSDPRHFYFASHNSVEAEYFRRDCTEANTEQHHHLIGRRFWTACFVGKCYCL